MRNFNISPYLIPRVSSARVHYALAKFSGIVISPLVDLGRTGNGSVTVSSFESIALGNPGNIGSTNISIPFLKSDGWGHPSEEWKEKYLHPDLESEYVFVVSGSGRVEHLLSGSIYNKLPRLQVVASGKVNQSCAADISIKSLRLSARGLRGLLGEASMQAPAISIAASSVNDVLAAADASLPMILNNGSILLGHTGDLLLHHQDFKDNWSWVT